MAQLSSPGVSVTVVDESFYTPGAPGTVPLIVVASQSNKPNAAGTGIAPGTLPANAGKVYLLTSQMDLGNTFGIPYFQTDAQNNPVNAGELNEYGLQAAYSFLGVSNQAYVVRADLDTSQLVGSATIPAGLPEDGTWWLDLGATNFGVFEWNSNSIRVKDGQTFAHQHITPITDNALVDETTYAPLDSVGAVGDYAMVIVTTLAILWYKKPQTDTAAGTWVKVGSAEWAASQPTAVGSVSFPTLVAAAGTPLTFTGYVDGTPGGSGWAGSSNTGTTLHIASGNYASMYSGISLLIGDWVITGTGTALDGRTITGVNGANGLIISGADISLNGLSGQLTPPGDYLYINGVPIGNVTNVSDLATAINAANIGGSAGLITAAAINGYLNLYSDGTATGYSGAPLGSITLSGTSVAKLGLQAKFYMPLKLVISPHYQPPEFGTFATAGSANGQPSGSVWIKTTPVNLGADFVLKRYNATTDSWVQQPVKLFKDTYSALAALDPLGGGINLPANTVFIKYNDDEHPVTPYADFKLYRRVATGATAITSSIIHNDTFTDGTVYQFYIASTAPGSSLLTPHAIGNTTPGSPGIVTFTAAGNAVTDSQRLVAAILQTVAGTSVTAVRNTNNSITITHTTGGDMYFKDNNTLDKLFTVGTTAYWDVTAAILDENYESGITWAEADTYVASLWSSTVGNPPAGFVIPSVGAPTTTPADQTLWYDTFLGEVDIMINNGHQWVGYLDTTAQAYNQQIYAVGGALITDPHGPIISASMPTLQSMGGSLANGDLWINPQDTEAFPTIYKFNGLTGKWVLIDNTDQLTSQGIVFADARWSDQGTLGTEQMGLDKPDTIKDLLTSNFVDFDAPDPALYPKGILLWNLRRSGYNVKKYVTNYVDINANNTRYTASDVFPEGQPMTYYYPDRWISDAPNDLNGVGQFGRKAQRAVVLKALLATINENQNIRQPDTVIFNLLSCPGYLEATSALISLNTDNGDSAFIVADAPARLAPDATTLSNWGNNTAGAAIDGEAGLIENYAYSAVYYPWAYTSDLLGNFIVVPPSHVMLRTIALSDNVSYPWFAPAGVRRGGVTNASSVGYVEAATGEFKTVALNTGQRDTLASIHVNPITYIAGTGLVCYGQKTRQLVASSLDRINVARLVIYMRYQLNIIAKPFIFEPNDTITRNEIKQQVEKFLLELVGQRALYDYLVVCDTSNNTPARIDANELHVDIAIEPVKAVEFIYIPLRLENTGAIKGLGK